MDTLTPLLVKNGSDDPEAKMKAYWAIGENTKLSPLDIIRKVWYNGCHEDLPSI